MPTSMARHIRTLLLTFFFRQMTQLISDGRIYIAQPPLYKVTRKKKVEYVKNKGAMRKALADLGTDGTSLVIRDKKGGEKTRIKGADLKKVLGLLEQLEDYANIADAAGCGCRSCSSCGRITKNCRRIG